MAKDGRIEIDEPRLLQTQRDLRALAGRVTRVEGQLDRHPLLRARYLIFPDGAANPNVGGAGTEWVMASGGAYDTGEMGVLGTDGRWTVNMPGWYEIHGMIFVTPSATHQLLEIKRRVSGLTGRTIGATSGATRAANTITPGAFNWHLNAVAGDVLSIVTVQGDAAGVMTPFISSSQISSWIEFIYRSHV